MTIDNRDNHDNLYIFAMTFHTDSVDFLIIDRLTAPGASTD